MSHQKTYILLAYDYEVPSYITSRSSQEPAQQTKILQEAISPEVSKLNHSVMSKKHRDQIQFSPEKKRLQKKEIGFITCEPSRPVDGSS